MSLGSFFDQEEEPPRVDLSPIIDMVFLLLLFFMVATTFDKSDAIRMQKAQAKSAKPIEEDRFKVLIDSAGLYHLGPGTLPLKDLLEETRNWSASHPKGAVLVVPDRRAPMEPFIKLVDELKLVGIHNFAIGTDPAGPGSSANQGAKAVPH